VEYVTGWDNPRALTWTDRELAGLAATDVERIDGVPCHVEESC